MAPGIEDSQRTQSWLREKVFHSIWRYFFILMKRSLKFNDFIWKWLKCHILPWSTMRTQSEWRIPEMQRRNCFTIPESVQRLLCTPPQKKEEISECYKHLNSLIVTFTKSTSESWGNQIQDFFFFSNNIWKYKRRDTRVKSNLDICQSFSRIKLTSQETNIFTYSFSS